MNAEHHEIFLVLASGLCGLTFLAALFKLQAIHMQMNRIGRLLDRVRAYNQVKDLGVSRR